MNVKNQELKFSIIMPCYNSEAYVRNAIDSVINQSYETWELIVVNDGSTDSTFEIVNSYAKNDNRIKVFSKENGGYVSAVNYALDRISGDYFLMMGSDDRISTDLLLQLNCVAKSSVPDMIMFRTLRFENGENRGIDKYTQFSTEVFENNTDIKCFECIHPVHAKIISKRDTSKAYKKSLLGEQRYFGKFGYDVDDIFSILFSHKAKSFYCIPFDGYMMTVRSDSVSGAGKNFRIAIDCLEGWIQYLHRLISLDKNQLTRYERDRMRYIYESECFVIRKCHWNDTHSIRLILKTRKAHISAMKNHEINTVPIGKISRFLYYRLPLIWLISYKVIVK